MDFADSLPDIPGGNGRKPGQCLDLTGNDREAAPGFTGSRGLDRRIEGQQVRLFGEAFDGLEEVADAR